MSITDELRNWWLHKFPVMDKELHHDFTVIADRIDAGHAELERENAELLARVAELDKRDDSMHEIGSATITITPTLDWTAVARELRSIADTLAGDAE